MEDLKLVAKAVGLSLDAPVEKVLDAIALIQAKAAEAVTWEKEAEDNLSKLVKTDALMKENATLKAENFINKAVGEYRIETAEAEVLKEMFMAGEDGEKAVIKLLATRKKGDYFTRKMSLTGREVPADPETELAVKVADIMANDASKSQAAAVKVAYAQDQTLFPRIQKARQAKTTEGGGR